MEKGPILDKELENRGHKLVRYSDDLAIFVKSKRAGERVLASVSRYLERKSMFRAGWRTTDAG